MGVISRDTGVISGAAGFIILSGLPTNGTNEVQTLTYGGTITGGTHTLRFGAYTTGPITWSATNATLIANVQAALNALPNIGAGGVVVTVGTAVAGVGTVIVTFSGASVGAQGPYTAMTVPANNLTGTAPTVTNAQTTPGVTASLRNSPTGELITNGATGIAYENKGTPGSPSWIQIGA